MHERLSSYLTFLYRAVFPVVWIAGFGLATLALWLGAMDTPEPPTPETKWGFLLGWILGTASIFWCVRRLRDVSLSGGLLIVRDFGKTVSIPLHLVEDVTETRFWNPKLIKVRLRPQANTPDQVVFLAPWALQLPFTDHPVVRRLWEEIHKANAASGSRSHVHPPFSRAYRFRG